LRKVWGWMRKKTPFGVKTCVDSDGRPPSLFRKGRGIIWTSEKKR